MIKRISAPSIRPRFQQSWLPSWRHAFMVVAIVFATLVAYLYVVPSSEISAANARIGQLKAEVAALERENADLLGDIAVYSDMKYLEQRATQLGMGPARGAVYLRLPADNRRANSASALTPDMPALDETPLTPAEFVRQLDIPALIKEIRAALVGMVDELVRRFSAR